MPSRQYKRSNWGIPPYSKCRVWGPYAREDGRKNLVVVPDTGGKTSVSYPKYLIELRRGAYLKSYETVHHKDENCRNNCLSNLEVLGRASHTSLHHVPAAVVRVVCAVCHKEFEKHNRRMFSYNLGIKRRVKNHVCSSECREQFRRVTGKPPRQGKGAPREHGTRARYRSGCKCAACRAAHAQYARELRARKE